MNINLYSKEFYKIDRQVPQDLKDLIEAFPQWLGEASRRGGLVLVLDALNQLDPRYNSHDLSWLPSSIPIGVKLLVSTLPGQCENVRILIVLYPSLNVLRNPPRHAVSVAISPWKFSLCPSQSVRAL